MLLDQDLSISPDLKFSSVRVGLQNIDAYSSWLSKGYNASMSYLARTDRLLKNRDTSLLEQGSKSILVFLLNYKTKRSSREGYGRVASYATFEDYHKFFPTIIEKFVSENGLFLKNHRTYVDTGPVIERGLVVSSSLGWIGKNSMLINPDMGSFTFIGVSITDLPLESDFLQPLGKCGKCTRCIEECPTGAINVDRTVNSNLCISYNTIENRGIIPRNISEKMGDMIFGCDVCNDVCPWNSGKRKSSLAEVQEDPYSHRMKLEEIAFIDKETFDTNYKGSAIKRAKFEGFARNALIALYNSGREDLVMEASRQFSDLRRDQASVLLDKR